MSDSLPRLSADALTDNARALRGRRRPGVVHLGLGAFSRSHQAWFTQRVAVDAEPWGIVAFTGRSPGAAQELAEQQCLFSVLERSASGDTAVLVDAIVAARDGADASAWRAAVASPDTAVLTLTVTEAAYCRGADGGVDVDAVGIADDLAVLVGGVSPAGCTTVPGRLVDGLRARRDAGAGPIAVVPCDNLSANGEVVRGVVIDLARRVDAQTGDSLADWIESTVSFVSSMVDRITPRSTDADRDDASRLLGYRDESAVVAEPFAEWILEGAFPAGRPAWETAGVRFVDDIEPFEQRKLWLLNAGHTLLACLGLLLGHSTIAETMDDPRCTDALEALWDEAAQELPLDADEVDAARAALRERFRNPRIQHLLTQIASDTSVKLPVRVVDPLRRRMTRGEGPGPGQTLALAAWGRLMQEGADIADAGAPGRRGEVPALSDALRVVAPDLADDPDLITAVDAAVDRLDTLLQGAPA